MSDKVNQEQAELQKEYDADIAKNRGVVSVNIQS